MLFIALAKYKTKLSKEVVAQNLKDIEADTKGQVRYLGIYWTLGRYDTVVLFEAPNEKVAMNLVLKRADRMEIEILVAVPAEEGSPAGPVWPDCWLNTVWFSFSRSSWNFPKGKGVETGSVYLLNTITT